MDKTYTNGGDKSPGRFSGATAAAFAVILAAVIVLAAAVSDKRSANTGRTAEGGGAAVLASLASNSAQEVDLILSARQAQESHSDIDAIPDEDIWSQFRDYVVLGDSRAVGFSYYGFLQDERVIADGGYHIRNALDALDTVRALAPSYIYLVYGLNDTGEGIWEEADSYHEECVEVLGKLQDAAPGAKIIVSSTLPVTASALADNPVWRKIPSFSAAMADACAETGAVYVDNTALAEAYMDELWDEDGVHLMPEFYPLWAKNLIKGAVS